MGDRPQYSIENGTVFYKITVQKTAIADADVATFKVVPLPPHLLGKCESTEDEYYAKDKNYVYYMEKRILDSQTESFEPLAESEYAKDKNSVFYRGQLLADANPETFRVLKFPKPASKLGQLSVWDERGENWSVHSVDKNHVWYQAQLWPNADAATFTLLPNHYAKDKKNVYDVGGHLVPGLNPETYNGDRLE